MVQKFNPTHSKIIESLATYKFLTYSQMLRVGVAKSKPYISRNMALLLDKKYVGRLDFGVHPTKGKLESFFYLLSNSKKMLVEESGWIENDIRIPIGKSSFFSKDYEHRKGVIDYQITVTEEAKLKNQKVVFFHTYFDKLGSARQGNLEALTSIQYGQGSYLIADAVFMLQTNNELDLYCLEYHRGIDAKRMLRTIEQYGAVLADGALSVRYGINKNAKVVCLFEEEICFEATKTKFLEDRRFGELRNFFLMKMLFF